LAIIVSQVRTPSNVATSARTFSTEAVSSRSGRLSVSIQSGHRIILDDEAQTIELRVTTGSTVTIEADGRVVVSAATAVTAQTPNGRHRRLRRLAISTGSETALEIVHVPKLRQY